MSLERMAQGLGGRVLRAGSRKDFASLSIDSRKLSPGQVFLAVRGERFDGHRFFEAVLGAGASVLVGESFAPSVRRLARRRGAGLILVPDGLEALQSLASDQRRLFSGPVAAISGSTGKTGTKDRLVHLLRPYGAVLATRGNFNNAVGLPLTLLEAGEDQRQAVLELGMNHAGELKFLAKIARPDVGVMTNVGDAHLAHFKDRRAVAAAKEELIQGLSSAGTAVLNGDDPLVRAMAARHRGRSLFFGTGADCDLRLRAVSDRGAGGLSARVEYRRQRSGWKLKLGGRASLWNSLAAAAAGLALGHPLDELSDRLGCFDPTPAQRLELADLGRARAVVDCYNASPQSMQAALEFLHRSAPAGRRLAVLGDMLELGGASGRFHREAGRQAAAAGIRNLAAVGDYSGELLSGFKGEGMAFKKGQQREAADYIAGLMQAGDWVLIKASHGMKLELAFNRLKERTSA